MQVLFAVTTFLGAALLFWSEPMTTKQILPLLGGSPAVWNTAVFLFQALLLAGYAWAHLLTRLRSVKLQAGLHLLVVAAGLFVTLDVGKASPEGAPVAWLLMTMLERVGLAFFALASGAPLLQRWFSRVSDEDPYKLYVASNLGSFLALLAFPFVLEPLFPLGAQRGAWRLLYGGFVLAVGVCAWVLVRRATPEEGERTERAPRLPWKRRLRWVALSAVPSSLVLGATTHLTTDLAAIPLFWVLPLALYLLTFVLAFRTGAGALPGLWPVLAFLTIVQLLVVGAGPSYAAVVPIILHLVVLFLAARLCHGELAADRPAPAHLTEFYLWISIGGAVGGLFNGVLAPLLFDSLAEYPLALVACLALAHSRGAFSLTRAATAGLLFLGLFFVARNVGDGAPVEGAWLGVRALIIYGVPFAALVWSARIKAPGAFAFIAGPVLVANATLGLEHDTLFEKRSFYGMHRVKRLDDGTHTFHALVHGGTNHGKQRRTTDSAGRLEPLLYYHSDGPAGVVLQALNARTNAAKVGIVGLGAGALASYGRATDAYTFYEIDPLTTKIARDATLFSYLDEALTAVDVVTGDGRLQLARATDRYDLLVLDAFSADSIPVHLLTKEALEGAYLPRLADDGWLLIHISNRYLALDGVVGALGDVAGLETWMGRDRDLDPETERVPSTWMVLARPGTTHALERLRHWKRWEGARALWTDDFSNLFRLLRDEAL